MQDHKSKFKMATDNAKQVTVVLVLVLSAAGISFGKYSGGSGEPNAPYRIATAEDLNDIGNQPEDFNGCFILVNDVNMAGFIYRTALIAPDTNSTRGFQGSPFTGVFDGNDRSISKLNINAAGAGNSYLGLFGKIGEEGEAKNIGIEEVIIIGGNLSYLVGSLCGVNHGTVNKCYASGYVDGRCGSPWYLGGLCGSDNGGTISGSYFLEGAGPDNGIGTPVTDTQMKQQCSFSEWDFVEVWGIGENQTYPFLRKYLAGDSNHDGIVNLYDYAIMALDWLGGKWPVGIE
jgi:hypothetical protein